MGYVTNRRRVAAAAKKKATPAKQAQFKPTVLVKGTPGAWKKAKELGMDLAGITGTGKNGYITADDVVKAAEG